MAVQLQPSSRFHAKPIIIALGVVFVLFLLLPSEAFGPASPTSSHRGTSATEEDTIPNILHFAYVLKDVEGDFNFKFSHLLSIYAASHYWQPQAIYLHTNVNETSPAVVRAREGLSSKWDRLILGLFDELTINTVEVPTHAGNGVEISGLEHRSDFVRVKAVHDIGGVYIDWDVYALRDIKVLRRSGFKGVAGRQLGGQINSGTFMAAKGSRLAKLWMDGMHQVYNGGWTTHSNEVITKVGQRLVREPGEMLILERDSFAPGSWEGPDTDALFQVHDDEPSNLANCALNTTLPWYEEEFGEQWDDAERLPPWARDWSSTYLLHAFRPERWGHQVHGYSEITPRYVLDRRSNFARAVYPIARRLHEQGLIDIEDDHTG